MRRAHPTESDIQSSYMSWLKLQYPKIFAVTASFANGGYRESRYGARLKREGLKKGFPDTGMFCPSGKYHGMFIEFKTKDGRVRKEQEEVMRDLSLMGYYCSVCRSLESAISETRAYLKNASTEDAEANLQLRD